MVAGVGRSGGVTEERVLPLDVHRRLLKIAAVGHDLQATSCASQRHLSLQPCAEFTSCSLQLAL